MEPPKEIHKVVCLSFCLYYCRSSKSQVSNVATRVNSSTRVAPSLYFTSTTFFPLIIESLHLVPWAEKARKKENVKSVFICVQKKKHNFEKSPVTKQPADGPKHVWSLCKWFNRMLWVKDSFFLANSAVWQNLWSSKFTFASGRLEEALKSAASAAALQPDRCYSGNKEPREREREEGGRGGDGLISSFISTRLPSLS